MGMKKMEKLSKINLVATFKVAIAKAIFDLRQQNIAARAAPIPNIPNAIYL